MVGIATIPNALPVPVLPDVSAEPHRITGAIAVALVALIVLLVGHQAELIPMPVIGGLVLVLVIGLELISVRRKDTVLACGPLPCGGRHDRDVPGHHPAPLAGRDLPGHRCVPHPVLRPAAAPRPAGPAHPAIRRPPGDVGAANVIPAGPVLFAALEQAIAEVRPGSPNAAEPDQSLRRVGITG